MSNKSLQKLDSPWMQKIYQELQEAESPYNTEKDEPASIFDSFENETEILNGKGNQEEEEAAKKKIEQQKVKDSVRPLSNTD